MRLVTYVDMTHLEAIDHLAGMRRMTISALVRELIEQEAKRSGVQIAAKTGAPRSRRVAEKQRADREAQERMVDERRAQEAAEYASRTSAAARPSMRELATHGVRVAQRAIDTGELVVQDEN